MATPTEKQPLLRTSNQSTIPPFTENLDDIKPLFKSTHREVIRDQKREVGFGFKNYISRSKYSNTEYVFSNKPPVLTRGAVFRHARSEAKLGCVMRAGFCLCCIPVSLCAASFFSNFPFAWGCIKTTFTGVEEHEGYVKDYEATKKLRERDFQLLGLNYPKLSEGIEEYMRKPEVETFIHFGHTYTPLFFDKSKLKGFLIFPNKDISKVIYKPAFDPDTGAPATTAQVYLMAQKACEDY